jgi:hypothetical protein
MRSPCIVCLLAALLVVASVDTIPDPPAVHSPNTVASAIRVARGTGAWRLSAVALFTPCNFRLRWIAFVSANQPMLASDWMVLTGYASDSSPPALHA